MNTSRQALSQETRREPVAGEKRPSRPLLRLAFMLFAMLLLFGCSSGEDALVGKWQGTDATDTMEFRSDRTFTISGDDAMKGTYSVSGGQLKLKLDGELGKALGEVSVPMSIENDTLKLTDSGSGAVEAYKRIK